MSSLDPRAAWRRVRRLGAAAHLKCDRCGRDATVGAFDMSALGWRTDRRVEQDGGELLTTLCPDCAGANRAREKPTS